MKIKDGRQAEYDRAVASIEADGSTEGAYYRDVLRDALAWTEVMETQITDGQDIAEIARKTIPHSSGYGQREIVRFVGHFWQYGDQVLTWYNTRF